MASTSPNMGLTVPDVNDEMTDFCEGIASSMTILDAIWPVGSIYLSTRSTDPATFLGGTWSRIQGRFLLGASSTYPAGSTGGSATHKHYKADTGGGLQNVAQSSGSYVVSNTNNVGSASSLPPYLAVYVWERTA